MYYSPRIHWPSEIMLVIFALVFARILPPSQANPAERLCRYSSRSGQTYAKEDSLWVIEGVNKRIACAARCLADARCDSFAMNKSLQLCEGLGRAGTWTPDRLPMRNIAAPGSNVYTSMCKVRESFIGKQCESNGDCKMSGLICHSVNCQCAATLLYSPTTQECLKCDTVGNTFTWFHGYSIDNYNDRMLKDIASKELCQELCLKEVDFTCRSAEYLEDAIMAMFSQYGHGTCIMSKETFGGVPAKYREYGGLGWVLMLRDCL